jgi:hypothetical protein
MGWEVNHRKRVAAFPGDDRNERRPGHRRRNGCGPVLAALVCGLTACSPQIPYRQQMPVRPSGSPVSPSITEQEIAGTWVGTTVCSGVGPRSAINLQLTLEHDYVSVDSCKTYVCERTFVKGLFERVRPGDGSGAVHEKVRVRGMLEGRGVVLERFDLQSERYVRVLDGDVSIDGATLSGAIEDCGKFSLRRRS